MQNILTLIGIGTIGWLLGRLTANLMSWIRRRNEKPNDVLNLSEYLRMRHLDVQARHNIARAQANKNVQPKI